MTRSTKDLNHDPKGERKGRTARRSDTADFRGYINLHLTDEEKRTFEVWAETASPVEVMLYHVNDGVQLSVKWSTKEECFLASATQRRVESPNAGLCVTARASHPQVALLRVLFLLVLLGHAETWEALQPMAVPDAW